MSRPAHIKAAIRCSLERAGVDGLTLPELCLLLTNHSYGTVGGTLSLLRTAGDVMTLRQGRVSVHFNAKLPVEACRAAFVRRLAARAGEAHTALQALVEVQAGPANKRAKPPVVARLRRDHHLANRTARAIRGDGTHQRPTPSATPPAPSAPVQIDPAMVQHCPGWRSRWAPTEPIEKTSIGHFDTPPSPWAAALLNRHA